MTRKFELSVARKAIYDLLTRIAADHQPAAQQALLGMMWKDEFDVIHLADGPDDYSTGNFAQSGTADWDWAALAYAATTYYGCTISDAILAAVPDSTWTAFAPGAGEELFDEGGMYTQWNAYIQIPADGKYLVIGNCGFHWQGLETIYGIRVQKINGSAVTLAQDIIEYDAAPPSSTVGGNNNGRLSACGMYDLSEDDQVQVQVYHNAGVDRNFGPVALSASLQGQRA